MRTLNSRSKYEVFFFETGGVYPRVLGVEFCPCGGYTTRRMSGPLRLFICSLACAFFCVDACAGKAPGYRVLLPDRIEAETRYRVLYALPVEAGINQRYGDPLEVFRAMNVPNQYGLILVVPQFETDPWYGNHATDRRRQYEDAMVKEIVPEVDRLYPTVPALEGRLLFGFSKSGWGAFTLILRNPGVFGYAASWDAPLMMTERPFGSWRTDETFGTAQNMAGYLPSRLLQERGAAFRKRERLVLAGKNLFGPACDSRFPYAGPSQTEAAHSLMERLGIRHRYDVGVTAPHRWDEAWIAPVLAMLWELASSRTRESEP
jgi:hypothetical protein